jgi:hypothetical protein
MAATLGRALIEVRADLSSFPTELRAKLKAALEEGAAGVKFDTIEEAAGRAGERAGTKLADGVDSSSRNRLRSIGENSATRFADGFSSFLGRALFGRASMWTSLIVAGGTAIASLLPAVYALAAAVPTVLGGLVAMAATLVLAFHGVGTAIGAAMSGDTEKLNEALKKLTPAARSFVQEIAKLRPELQALQRSVQQAFFVQLEGSLTRVTRNLLPTLKSGLTGLGASFGQVGKQIADALSGGTARTAFADVFAGMRTAASALAPALGNLTRAFLQLMSAANPMVTTLGVGLAHVVDEFSRWIDKASQSGALSSFFEAGLTVLRTFGTLLANVGSLLSAIVNGLVSGGGGAFLGVLGTLVGMLAALFASAQGQSLLSTLGELVSVLGVMLTAVLTPLLPAVAQLVDAFGQQLVGAIVALTPSLVQLASALVPLLTFVADHADVFGPIVLGIVAFSGLSKLFVLLVPAIEAATVAMLGFDAAADANPIGLITLAIEALIVGIVLLVANWKTVAQWGTAAWHGILAAGKAVWEWLKGAGSAVGDWFAGIGDWFAALPGRIGSWLAALPGALAQAFVNAVNAAAQALGFAVGLIIGEMLLLPGRIVNAISSLGSMLAGAFSAAWAWVVSTVQTGITNVLAFLEALPGRAAAALAALPGMIGGAFRDAWNWAKREVSAGADAVVDFARKLPGRIGGFFDNVGHAILNGLKSGINGVIGSFNHGIDNAGSFLHISLPHIPYLAQGGIVDSPTLAMIGERGREVVLPTDNPARAQELLEQSGLASMMAQGATGSTNVYVTAVLGTGEILKVLDQRVELKVSRQADNLASGVRSM